MQAAYTNLIVNGVRRITGLHNLTIDDLKSLGKMNIDLIPRVVYKEDFKPATVGASEQKSLEWIQSFLALIHGDNTDKKREWLEKETSFKAKDGKQIPGKRSTKELTAKQIPFVYRAARQLVISEIEKLAKELWGEKTERDKKLIQYSAVPLENNEIEVGVSEPDKMSNVALGVCYEKLFNLKLDQQAKKEEVK
jgi:hypothetical protein